MGEFEATPSDGLVGGAGPPSDCGRTGVQTDLASLESLQNAIAAIDNNRRASSEKIRVYTEAKELAAEHYAQGESDSLMAALIGALQVQGALADGIIDTAAGPAAQVVYGVTKGHAAILASEDRPEKTEAGLEVSAALVDSATGRKDATGALAAYKALRDGARAQEGTTVERLADGTRAVGNAAGFLDALTWLAASGTGAEINRFLGNFSLLGNVADAVQGLTRFQESLAYRSDLQRRRDREIAQYDAKLRDEASKLAFYGKQLGDQKAELIALSASIEQCKRGERSTARKAQDPPKKERPSNVANQANEPQRRRFVVVGGDEPSSGSASLPPPRYGADDRHDKAHSPARPSRAEERREEIRRSIQESAERIHRSTEALRDSRLRERGGAGSDSPRRSSGTGSTCFAAGTLVLMADFSYQQIERIRPGDLVMSVPESDPIEGGLWPGRVLRTFDTADVEVFEAGGLIVTSGHPFLASDLSWSHLRDLDRAHTLGGELRAIKLERSIGVRRVFNLEVEQFHTFVTLGDHLWLVHNGNSSLGTE